MPEARLDDFGSGLVPVTDGWFVVNVRDAEWWTSERMGARCAFECEYPPAGVRPLEFTQLGINLTVLEPGQTGLYHAESAQESFLVLAGECTLLVEDAERPLRAWDLFHAPPWTAHILVGAGSGPCVILMAGARIEGAEVRYPVSAVATRHGAGVDEETSDWRRAYANVEPAERRRPPSWDRLPWA
ncbi:MAG TPA: cupin domain-containing protein [Gaiellales bacterium]|nr:cupin domain-containing protein [Gaiellales bacterium]